MRFGISDVMDMFYDPWIPPKELPESVVTRRHRILDDSKVPRKEPVQARTKIMAVLGKYDWQTIEEIAKQTSLAINTVVVTTDRMYKSGKLERTKKLTPFGRVNVYRKK